MCLYHIPSTKVTVCLRQVLLVLVCQLPLLQLPHPHPSSCHLTPPLLSSLPPASSQPPAAYMRMVKATVSSTDPSSAPGTQLVHTMSGARATHYKRKLQAQESSDNDPKVSRVQKLPLCKGGQPTRAHKKYKKKNFCPVKMKSLSKAIDSLKAYNSNKIFL